jgi:alkylated DNA repair dioxygenase AlkB
MPDITRYDLPHSAYERLIEARDSLRLLDSYVNKTDVLCNPSMLVGYVSMLQEALQAVIDASVPAEPRDTFMRKADELGFVALNLSEQTMIKHLRWVSLEGREEIYAMTERLRALKPWVLER